jgi:hypothetical protein
MADSFTLVFDRKGIENIDFSIIKEFIIERDFNEVLLYDARSRLNISFFGYDDEPRELYEIAEVINWVKYSILEEKIPWFFFLSTNEASQGIKLLALCFCSVAVRGMDGNYFLQADTSKLREFALVNFGILNEFMGEHKLNDGINNEISQNVLEYLRKWLDRSGNAN